MRIRFLYSLLLFSYLSFFVTQQFVLNIGPSPVRPYMIFGFVNLVLIFPFLTLKVNLLKIVTSFDFIVVTFYCLLCMFSLHANNDSGSTRLVVGILILLLTYFNFSILLRFFSLNHFVCVFKIFIPVFFVMSFFWYLYGIYHFYTGVSIFNVEDPYILIEGVYFESGFFPRLRGFADSPNNFGMYSLIFFILVFSDLVRVNVYNKFIMVLCMLLTFSTTLYIIIFMLGIAFFRTQKIMHLFIFTAVTSILIFGLYSILDVDLINKTFNDRLNRIESGSGRFELFEYSFNIFLKEPIFGYGLNQAREILQPFRDLKSAHNNILEVALEGGMVAVFLYLIFNIFIFIYSYIVFVNKGIYLVIVLNVAYFIFGMSNVTLYSDSFIFILSLTTYFYSISLSNSSSKNIHEPIN